MQTENQEMNQTGKIHIFHAALSMLVPGLGQLFQRRFEAFLGYLLLFGLTALIPCIIIAEAFSQVPTFFWNEGNHYYFPLFLFPLAVILFSILDAANWRTGHPSGMKRPSLLLGKWIVAFYVCYFIYVLFLAPALSAARESLIHRQCTNNLKKFGLALYNYYDDYKTLPPAYTVDENGKPLHSWRVLILPYIEQQELYEKIRLDEPWDSEHNRQFHSVKMNVFQCPNDQWYGILRHLKKLHPEMNTDGLCCYSVILGEETPFTGKTPVLFEELQDGTSNTIGVVERLIPVCWMDPAHEITFSDACRGINCHTSGLGSPHEKGCNVLFMDGSVQYLSESITQENLKALFTKSRGEKIRWNDFPGM